MIDVEEDGSRVCPDLLSLQILPISQRYTRYVGMTECVCDTCHHHNGICTGFTLDFGMVIQYCITMDIGLGYVTQLKSSE